MKTARGAGSFYYSRRIITFFIRRRTYRARVALRARSNQCASLSAAPGSTRMATPASVLRAGASCSRDWICALSDRK